MAATSNAIRCRDPERPEGLKVYTRFASARAPFGSSPCSSQAPCSDRVPVLSLPLANPATSSPPSAGWAGDTLIGDQSNGDTFNGYTSNGNLFNTVGFETGWW